MSLIGARYTATCSQRNAVSTLLQGGDLCTVIELR